MSQSNTGWQIAALSLIALTLGAAAAHAQVYRSVGPDGRVTFSDQPPAAGTGQSVSTAGGGSGGGGQLPYELRQVANRYPVTLYTGQNCAPCGSARSLLTSRGIPFTEKTVTSKEDGEALNRISGSTNLPLVTVGSQQIKGHSPSELTQFLDAAGYPASSKLPIGYLNAPASPLVEVQRPAAANANGGEGAETPRAAPRKRRAAPVEDTNPAGIRF